MHSAGQNSGMGRMECHVKLSDHKPDSHQEDRHFFFFFFKCHLDLFVCASTVNHESKKKNRRKKRERTKWTRNG